jgi:DNA polymerase
MPLPKKKILSSTNEIKEEKLSVPDLPQIVSASGLNTLKSIQNTVEKCNRCNGDKNHKSDNIEILLFHGDSKSKVVFIQDFPYFNKESLKVFDKSLKYCDKKREDIYLTSIIKCPFSEVVAEDEINCRIYLERELEIINPDVVVTLGLSSLKFLLPKVERIQDWVGKIISTDKFSIIPINHPSIIISPEEEEIDEQKRRMESIFQFLEKVKN